MSSKIKLELKVGEGPQEGRNDAREVFSGIIDQAVGSTISDDKWFKRMPGQRQEDLFFALHVSEGHAAEVLQEIYDYNQSVKSAGADESSSSKPISPIAFINGLRSRYVNRMPSTAEGSVVYGIKFRPPDIAPLGYDGFGGLYS